LNKGAEIRAKSLMCVLKKFHNPTNDQIVLISVGGLASFMALTLTPDRIKPGKNARFDPVWSKSETQIGYFLVAKHALFQVDLEVILV
jgi:hypothetical protein